MEALVAAGRVTVNGAPARIGARVGPRDVIQVDGRPLRRDTGGSKVRVLLYHKPEGEIVSRDDPAGRASVFEHLPGLRGAKWLPVGRLDINSCGLLLFTTSGEVANRMMHPRFALEREYAVRLLGKLAPEQTARLKSGVRLDDGMARCEQLDHQGGKGVNQWYRIVVKEGRKRVVRRLFEALGFRVSRLMRIRFGAVVLPRWLRRGQFKELAPEEVRRLLASLGLETAPPETRAAPGSAGTRRHRRSYRAR